LSQRSRASPHADPEPASAARAESRDPSAPLPSAGLWRRLAALGYEALLLAAILIVAGFLLSPLVSPPAVDAARPVPIPPLPERIATFAALVLLGAAFFGWSWTGARRTLPMKTWNLRLVRRDGAPVDAKSALVRYATAWLGPALALAAYAALAPSGHARVALALIGLNYAWALVDPDRQFLHDRIAGTRLVVEARARRR
jgi:uncharacterized RDD family membrane protein YckC